MSAPVRHPDPEINMEVHADILEGHVATLRAVLTRVLDLDLGTPKGQRVKELVRHALSITNPTK